MEFTFYQPTRIVVATNQIERIVDLCKVYGNRCLLVGPKMNPAIAGMYENIIGLLVNNGVVVIPFLQVDPNPSSVTVEQALLLGQQENIEFVLAVGGGSSMDVGKLVSSCFGLTTLDWAALFDAYNNPFVSYPPIAPGSLPLVVVPTTSGTGSQCTQAAVITDEKTKLKLTIYHPDNYPKVAMIDASLMMTLPPVLTASTAFDAFTHAFEPYLVKDNHPMIDLLALEAIGIIATTLPNAMAYGRIEDREQLALADCYAGMCLANGGACLPHPMGEIIGSYVTKLNHGQSLALVYPIWIKHTKDKYQKKFAHICRLFDDAYVNENDEVAAEAFASVMERFLDKVHLHVRLDEFGYEADKHRELIATCPIFGFLAMESQDVIHAVLKETLDCGESPR